MSAGRCGWLAVVPVVVVVVVAAGCNRLASESPGTASAPPSAAAPSTQASGQAGVHVSGRGVDAGNAAICEDFQLTDSQAQAFFARAQPISAAQLHDDYDVLPCWVEGSTGSDGDTSKWKIRAGGTAEVTAPNGDVSYLGCKTCDDILQ